jgi:nucleoside-diphosphate-sugar epimerase
MRTLIIGAGLVGSQIARILVEEGERPVLMDRAHQVDALGEIVDLERVVLAPADVLHPLELTGLLREHAVDAIVHTAANPMLTLGAQRDPYPAVQLNIMGTMNALEAARILGIKRVVVASSNVLNHFIAGGEGAGDPAHEEAFPRPTTFYATTKQAVENLGLNYARWCGLEFAALRYGAVFGPWRGQGGGGPSNVMREVVRRALAGEEAVLPSGRMEWVYSKDAAHGTVLALKARSLPSRVFNITMGVVAGPDDIVSALRTVIQGVKVRVETPAAAAISLPDMTHPSDLRLAQSVLGYAPRFGLLESLRDFIAWMAAKVGSRG